MNPIEQLLLSGAPLNGAPPPPPDMGMGGIQAPQTAPAANTSGKYIEQDGKHKGVAGAARDVLGFLGDFLLTRLHMKPMYAPAQEQRQLNAAYQGYDQDPNAAISRVRDVDFEVGQKLAQQKDLTDYKDAQLKSIQGARAARAANLAFIQEDKNRKLVQNTLGAIDPKDPRAAEMYSQARNNFARKFADTDPDLLAELPPQYDPDAIKLIAQAGIPISKRTDQALRQAQIDNGYEIGMGNLDERIRNDDLNHSDRADRNATYSRATDIAGARQQETAQYHKDQLPIQQQTADARTVGAGASASRADTARRTFESKNQDGMTKVVQGVKYTRRNGQWFKD